MEAFTVFLPCRAGSKRIPQKNTRPFAGCAGGLTEIKLGQLLKTGADTILVSTDDEAVAAIAAKAGDSRVRVVERPTHLASDSASTDDLIRHVPELIPEGWILWTHVTSPFLNEEAYCEVMRTLPRWLDEGYDSALSVNRIQSFIWNASGPLNYSREREKWPRTQTLEPWFEVNSGFFLARAETYRKIHDRIGERPFLWESTGVMALDIDWEDDFRRAERLWLSRDNRAGGERHP